MRYVAGSFLRSRHSQVIVSRIATCNPDDFGIAVLIRPAEAIIPQDEIILAVCGVGELAGIDDADRRIAGIDGCVGPSPNEVRCLVDHVVLGFVPFDRVKARVASFKGENCATADIERRGVDQ